MGDTPQSKSQINAQNIGVVGDHNIIYGGINFYNVTSARTRLNESVEVYPGLIVLVRVETA